ncbi:hypothetical protein AAFF_G00239850 [Aldrovandia affinis]|uniref:Uncharacterized protein n=1 Tax=Aldrovandia affinis TaxID=143900 RepID=A0AAD7SUE4_9TELE|nr:hypothetical protein AAFF_G00239850 [Aldrovandia affinis]
MAAGGGSRNGGSYLVAAERAQRPPGIRRQKPTSSLFNLEAESPIDSPLSSNPPLRTPSCRLHTGAWINPTPCQTHTRVRKYCAHTPAVSKEQEASRKAMLSPVNLGNEAWNLQ